MQYTLYVETPSHTMWRNLSKSSITNNTVRKDVPTSHQRVQSLTIQSLTENRMHFKLI